MESSVIDTLKRISRNQSEEACLGVFNSWLNAKPGTGVAERTWRSVLEALETSAHRQLADALKREHFGESSEDPHSEPTSAGVCAAGLWRECTCYRHFRRFCHLCTTCVL